MGGKNSFESMSSVSCGTRPILTQMSPICYFFLWRHRSTSEVLIWHHNKRERPSRVNQKMIGGNTGY